jgi:D-3-phosphoglycerate dehydrogenase / 2-oxoglutarate reductase
MSRRILVNGETYSRADRQLQRLADAGFDLVQRPDLDELASQDTLAAALDGTWGVIAGGESYSRELLASADTLRVIARPGAGYDAIDLRAASEAGILVFTTPGANRHAVADFAVALMLAVLRQLSTIDRDVRIGKWGAAPPARDLHGAVVGIVGLGAIGRTVAQRLSGFECRVIGSDPMIDADTARESGIELLPLMDTLTRAEVLTLHVPLIAETRGLIGTNELRAMRSDAVLINTARGPVIQQDALVDALSNGEISAAALDVFETEPLHSSDPIVRLPNVLLSSHVASHTVRGIDAMVGGAVDGILEIADGRAPQTALNRRALQA